MKEGRGLSNMSVVVVASGEKGQGRGSPTYLRIRYMRGENEEGSPTREKLAKIPLPPLPPTRPTLPFFALPMLRLAGPPPPGPLSSSVHPLGTATATFSQCTSPTPSLRRVLRSSSRRMCVFTPFPGGLLGPTCHACDK